MLAMSRLLATALSAQNGIQTSVLERLEGAGVRLQAISHGAQGYAKGACSMGSVAVQSAQSCHDQHALDILDRMADQGGNSLLGGKFGSALVSRDAGQNDIERDIDARSLKVHVPGRSHMRFNG